MSQYPPVNYSDYLNLDKILTAQHLKSEEYKDKAHDEMLFIIVHQAYELWFKQIITEIDSIADVFQKKSIDDTLLGLVVSRLERIVEIQHLLIHQIRIMETMTALDFLEFRDCLYPASGFQSMQNRLIENKLGLRKDKRLQFNKFSYEKFLTDEEKKQVAHSENSLSLFQLVESWLERTPFLTSDGFDYWAEYQKAVKKMFIQDKETIRTNPMLSDEDKKRNDESIDNTLDTFEALFDEKRYKEMQEKGLWRLSYRALHAALFIHIYRDQPVLQLPFNLLRSLLDIDENFTTWRHRHALMAHRMLGQKIGTGGSSGHQYLRQATEKHKIFSDLFNLTTFFIPRSKRPALPKELIKKLGFYYAQPGN